MLKHGSLLCRYKVVEKTEPEKLRDYMLTDAAMVDKTNQHS